MSIFFKTSQKMKKIVTAFLSVCTLSCVTMGISLLVGKADSALTDITAPTTGYNAVAHYEFNDVKNLGKDSLGNYNLVAQNVGLDAVNGGVAIKDGGVMYAPALADGKSDFSDLVKGSYSLSMRVFMRSVNDGANNLIATGAYGSHFQVAWAYEGLAVYLGNSQSLQFGTSATALGEKPMFDTTFAWYRITMIYDESAMTFRVMATKEGDESYSFDATANLTAKSVFGGLAERTFTIGAQSNFGDWLDQQVNTTVSDGVNEYEMYPNISNLRMYSGVIDATEIAEIVEYDENNLVQKAAGYSGVVHYEFKYPNHLGKDSLGNYDLVATDGVVVDEVNGGVTLSGENGIFYAPSLDEKGTDFSDLIKGSYSLSMRVFMRSVEDGANNLISTGSYGSAFQIAWAYEGLSIDVGNSQNLQFGTSATALAEKAMFDEASAWYRITMIYEEIAKTFRVIATKENDTSYIYDYTATLSSTVSFGGDTNGYGFTIGAQSKNGESLAQHVGAMVGEEIVYPNISDFRLYTGVIDNEEITAIQKYDAENFAANDWDNAVEKEVRPLVWYEFNDASNLGKDSMGNFDLLVGGQGNIAHSADGYVTFTRENASVLYAPTIFGASDWSDLLKGGYTLSYTVKANNEIEEGDRYAITTSNYANAFQVIGCRNGYEVVYSAGGHKEHAVMYETGSYKDTWVNITVSMDTAKSKLSFYVNGLLFDERTVADYQGFTSGNNYAFTIGGQATTTGADSAQFFEGSIADVKVYDFALSSKNVKDMYDKANTETPFTSLVVGNTVDSVEIDTTELNLIVSGNNTVDNILAKLPTTVTVKDKNATAKICSVVWLGYENGSIKGYLQNAPFINVESIFAEVKLSCVVDFATLTNAVFTDIKIDGVAYENQAIEIGQSKILTFKVTPNNGYKVGSVSFNNQKIEPDADGLYAVTIDDYSQVSAYIQAEEYMITYVLNNGQDNEEQIYAYGESVVLADYFVKEGYVFDGWYDNEDLSGEKVTSIDSQNPSDITLYAKWVESIETPDDSNNGNTDGVEDEELSTNGGSSGCNGSIGISMGILPLCLLGIAFVVKKKGANKNE